jgi:hypothetical protein
MSSSKQIVEVLEPYRFKNQTWQQRLVSVVALVLVVHFAVGTYLWLLFIYSQTVTVVRYSQPGGLWGNLAGWIPFYSQIWKSTTPLGVSTLAIYLVPHRTKLAGSVTVAVVVFSVVCALYDITTHACDLSSFVPDSEHHINHYFTWWWCDQRSR